MSRKANPVCGTAKERQGYTVYSYLTVFRKNTKNKKNQHKTGGLNKRHKDMLCVKSDKLVG